MIVCIGRCVGMGTRVRSLLVEQFPRIIPSSVCDNLIIVAEIYANRLSVRANRQRYCDLRMRQKCIWFAVDAITDLFLFSAVLMARNGTAQFTQRQSFCDSLNRAFAR